jgi:hypothetical protein
MCEYCCRVKHLDDLQQLATAVDDRLDQPEVGAAAQ